MKNLTFNIISIILYVVALLTPMFFGSDSIGLSGLLLGWIGLIGSFDPYIGLPWLANITYFINIIFLKIRLEIRIICSILTIILGMFATGIKEELVHEGGLTQPISVGIGFSIWILSFIILLIGQLMKLKKTLGNST